MLKILSAFLIVLFACGSADARPRKHRATTTVTVEQCDDNGRCTTQAQQFKGASRPFQFASGRGNLESVARRYMGTNPTGWRRVWCGKFMELVVREAGGRIPRDPALARSWANLDRVAPQVGAIAVMSRGKRGGHVGIVTGFEPNGDPRILSGNHGRRVGEGVYPRSRIKAWVTA